jgi:hypothetical protein
MLDLGPNPVKEPECITVPVPLPQKIAVPAVPAQVPQHWKKLLFLADIFLFYLKKTKSRERN